MAGGMKHCDGYWNVQIERGVRCVVRVSSGLHCAVTRSAARVGEWRSGSHLVWRLLSFYLDHILTDKEMVVKYSAEVLVM
jgi:hypothetical protein